MRYPFTLALAGIGLIMAPLAHAERIGRGHSLICIGINGYTAQLISSPLSIQDGAEIGVKAAYSYFFSDAWTVVASGGVATGKRRLEVPTVPPFKYASHSWNVRLGLDRYAFINDEVALYAGP